MRTYKDYVVEATDERLEEIKAYLKSKKLDKIVSSVTVEGRNYYAIIKHEDYTAKFLFDNDAYKKNSFYGNDFLMHRLASVTILKSNNVLYNSIWHRYFTEIVDYLKKFDDTFGKLGNKIIGLKINDVENEIKRIDNKFKVSISTKFKNSYANRSWATVYNVRKALPDANNIEFPYFEIEFDCTGDTVSRIKEMRFGFGNRKTEMKYEPYKSLDLKACNDAFMIFKYFINEMM